MARFWPETALWRVGRVETGPQTFGASGASQVKST